VAEKKRGKAATREQNLKPQSMRTKDEQRKVAAMGGKASGEARKRRKTFKDVFTSLLECDVSKDALEPLQGVIKSEYGDKITADQAMALAQIVKAVNGDTKAFEVIRDTIGEKPTDKTELSGDMGIKVELAGDIKDWAK
jgi:hypothetical protein